ncbi:MAG: coiled-coil domain-containing protein [Chloroflexota bacterium]
MFRLSRVHFESVGHGDARFDPLDLNFCDEQGVSTDVVLWLRNMGGKTSMLALFYSLLQPHTGLFLGSRSSQKKGGKPKSLEQYVMPDDVAHVVAEWILVPPDGTQLEGMARLERRITGQVMAWREAAGRRELHRVWYAFTPVEGELELSNPSRPDLALPFHLDERHRMPMSRFVARLREFQTGRSKTQMFVTESQNEWKQHLDSLGLDTELFRYQLDMNDHEGGVEEFLQFKDGDTFVSFFLKMVTDPSSIVDLDDSATELASHFQRRPMAELEVRLTDTIAEHAPKLLGASDLLATAREDRGRRLGEAASLRSSLAASARSNAEEQKGLLAEATQLKEQAGQVEAEFKVNQGYIPALDHESARLLVAEIERETEAAESEAVGRQRIVEAWQVADHRQEERDLREETQSLREFLRKIESDPDTLALRRDYEQAAARYRLWLTDQLSAAASTQKEASAEAEKAEGAIDRANERIRSLEALAAGFAAKKSSLEERLADFEHQKTELVEDGLVRIDETISDALARLERDLAEVTAALSRVEEEQAELERRERTLRTGQAERAGILAKADAKVTDLTKRRVALVARIGELSAERHISTILEDDSSDLLSMIPVLLEKLAVVVSEVDRALLDLEAEESEAKRAKKAIGATDLLPGSLDAERALELLKDAGITASTGWRYLSGTYEGEERQKKVSLYPDLASGIVVRAGGVEQAAKSLAGFVPNAPLAISDGAVWESGRTPGYAVILPPTGLYDQERAEEQLPRLTAFLKEVDERRKKLLADAADVRDLRRELEGLKRESPADGLPGLEREIGAVVRERNAAASQIAQANEALAGIAARMVELKDERKKQNERHSRLGESRGRLKALAQLSVEAARWPSQIEEWSKEIQSAQDSISDITSEIDDLRFQARTARKRSATAQSLGSSLRAFLDGVPEVTTGESVTYDAGASREALERSFKTAERHFNEKTSESVEAQRLKFLEAQLGQITTKLQPYSGEVLQLANELLDGPDGASPETRVLAASKARQDATTAQANLLDCRRRLKEARAELDRKPQSTGRRATLPPDYSGTTHAEAEAHLVQLRRKNEDLRAKITGLEKEASDRRGRGEAAGQRATLLKALDDRVGEAMRDWDGEIVPGAPPEVLTVDEAQSCVDGLMPLLDEARRRVSSCERAVRDKAEALRVAVRGDEFNELAGKIWRDRFLASGDEELAATSKELLPEILKLNEWLRSQLVLLHQHKDAVASALQGHVIKALSTLNDARDFKLPAGLGRWSGETYLKIDFDEPDADILNGRIQVFVDDLMRGKSRFGGVSLLVEAVRAAVGGKPFAVSVLKPNEGLPRGHHPISDISTWSGGQKLTTALLLYCVLVRHRSRNRRRHSLSRARVLILDNPIGTANLAELVGLQLTVASKLGIQLVVTTGVNDYEAINAYPRIIRFRNRRRVDGKGGMVVVDEVITRLGEGNGNGGEAGLVSTASIYKRGYGASN